MLESNRTELLGNLVYVLVNFLGGAFDFAFVTSSSDGHAAAALVDCGPQIERPGGL